MNGTMSAQPVRSPASAQANPLPEMFAALDDRAVGRQATTLDSTTRELVAQLTPLAGLLLAVSTASASATCCSERCSFSDR